MRITEARVILQCNMNGALTADAGRRRLCVTDQLSPLSPKFHCTVLNMSPGCRQTRAAPLTGEAVNRRVAIVKQFRRTSAQCDVRRNIEVHAQVGHCVTPCPVMMDGCRSSRIKGIERCPVRGDIDAYDNMQRGDERSGCIGKPLMRWHVGQLKHRRWHAGRRQGVEFAVDIAAVAADLDC